MDKLISIIVPAYNAEKYLERCINSILAQTYSNIEVIVVDDSSKDNTYEVLMKLSKTDTRIKPFQKENFGVSLAREFGINHSSGQLIGFVDADDEIDKDMYKTLYSNMVKFDADISHCGHMLIDNMGNKTPVHGTGIISVQDHDKGIKDLLDGSLVEPGLWTKLYRRELFNNLEYDREIRINEDFLINVLLFNKAKRAVFFDMPFYLYYSNEMSASKKAEKEYFLKDIIKVIDYTNDIFRDTELFPYAQRRWFRIICTMYGNKNKSLKQKAEYDQQKFFADLYKKFIGEYKSIKKNITLTIKDKAMLKMLRRFPWLLAKIREYR